MGLYRERVLPRIVDVSRGSKKLEPLRRRVCEGLAGAIDVWGFSLQDGRVVEVPPAS
jgi:hypothetical protein